MSRNTIINSDFSSVNLFV